MKHLFTTLCFFCSLWMTAQRTSGNLIFSNKTPDFLATALNGCDTAAHVAFGLDSAVVYHNTGTGNWGYVSGTNSYRDIAKAEKFFATEYTSGYQLAGGIFYFAKAVDGNTPTAMKLSAWDDDGVSAYPNSELAHENVLLSSFVTDTAYTTLLFSTPVPVSGDFYLGLDGFVYATPQEDTVALYTSTKSVTINSAYERWVDSSWHAFSQVNNWNFKSRLFIAAILCNTQAGSVEIINPSDDILIFPNPAAEIATLNAGKKINGFVHITLTDVLGKTVYSSSLYSETGNYPLPVSGIISGIYHVSVATSTGIRSTRLQIQ